MRVASELTQLCSGTVFLLILLVSVSSGSHQEISISLVPRDYSDPRTAANFICGKDTNIDSERLVAEQNAAYIFDLLDNTMDKSEPYRTEVFDIISFRQSGSPLQIMDGKKFNKKTGLYSLFLVTAMRQCNIQLFEDAVAEGHGYFPVYVGHSNVFEETEILERFKTDATILKKHFSSKTEELPKLCGSFTPVLQINNIVAISRKETLVQVFNFMYNEERDPSSFSPGPETNCRSKEETEHSLYRSFPLKTMHFVKMEDEVKEAAGFLEAKIEREETSNKAVVFIDTVDQSADDTDFVRYTGPAVFSKNDKTASFYMRLKNDNDTENETFTLKIRDMDRRKKRMVKSSSSSLAQGQGSGSQQGQEEKITLTSYECYTPETLFINDFSSKLADIRQTKVSTEEVDGFRKYWKDRIKTEKAAVVSIAISKEENDIKIVDSISLKARDEQTGDITKRVVLSGRGVGKTIEYDPHSEPILLEKYIVPDFNPPTYKKVDYFKMDVSWSPCFGCNNALDVFIEKQIEMASKESPFKFEFSFSIIYKGESISDHTMKEQESEYDASTIVKQAVNTAKFISNQKAKVNDAFSFIFVDELMNLEDVDEMKNIQENIFDIYVRKPDENKLAEVTKLMLILDNKQKEDKTRYEAIRKQDVELKKDFQAEIDRIDGIRFEKENMLQLAKEELKTSTAKVEVKERIKLLAKEIPKLNDERRKANQGISNSNQNMEREIKALKIRIQEEIFKLLKTSCLFQQTQGNPVVCQTFAEKCGVKTLSPSFDP